MIADYSAKIKIAIFLSIWKHQRENKNHRQIAGKPRQKLRVLTA